MARRLVDPPYLAFPLHIGDGTPQVATRAQHIRGQIEQVLFTLPGERVFRPDLAHVPVVVLSNNDGCVIARSYDAKPFIKMGEPYFQIKHKLRQQQKLKQSLMPKLMMRQKLF